MSSSSPVKCDFCLLSRSYLTEPVLFAARLLDIQDLKSMAGRGFYDEFIVLRCISDQTGSDCTRGYQFSVNLGHEHLCLY